MSWSAGAGSATICEPGRVNQCPAALTFASTKPAKLAKTPPPFGLAGWKPRMRSPLGQRFWGRIAQLVEQLTLNQRVQGSSPCAPTIISRT